MRLLKEDFKENETLDSLLNDWHNVSKKIENTIKSAQISSQAKRFALTKLYYWDRKIPSTADELNEKVIDTYKLYYNLTRIGDEMYIRIGDSLPYEFPEYKSEAQYLSNSIANATKEYETIARKIIEIIKANSSNKNKYDRLQYIEFR